MAVSSLFRRLFLSPPRFLAGKTAPALPFSERAAYSRLSKTVFGGLALAFLALSGLSGLNGCAPIGQRTFDPEAGRPPQVALPPEPPPKPGKRPFIEIMDGTPDEDYAQALDKAVRLALTRKPNILFVVEAAAPMQAAPAAQVKILQGLTRRLALPVGNRIIAAGAEPIQLDMRAVTDPLLKQAVVRINVR